ncbi:acyl-CoA dehydrogenase family protein [Gordonia McavH-238-E]|uniref:acyl-CoA dehydrogenase family protein n=1 Tax=Gordonia sp. McavH-238-E TaxID=2917736 RepID=UPI001EF6C91F|nr:acyl-CoA dehydrogenase family protein [Gordonia sp. McavH-238-E]MCG7633278.1 acyl-CoA dehydrogenase family protein [Gordonia sp. McavH-238-E]
MAWDFSTDPEYQKKLDWAQAFVRDELFPLDTLDLTEELMNELVRPLQARVKEAGLWAAHLPPALGGGGFGQVKLGLLHEIVGQSRLAPLVFGNNAPDSGNAELLALGIEQNPQSEWQRERWLQPLLDGDIRSAFSMTEPGAGSDPTLLSTTAVLDGDEWIINGHKWFTSHGSVADILIVMVVTDPDAAPHQRSSMIVVPAGTPGVRVLRDVSTMEDPEPHFGRFGAHSEILYEDVRVPAANLVGERGRGFLLAQQRLGPGRIHHCMRWLGQSQRAFDMLCERSLSRYAHGSLLADKQTVQNWIADSKAEMEAARLLTLHAAWKMDTYGVKAALTDISLIKFYGAQVLYNVIDRAVQIHGALGLTTDLPLEYMYRAARAARIYDGPDEVHRATVARRILRDYEPAEVPSQHVPSMRAHAQDRFAETLELHTSNL